MTRLRLLVPTLLLLIPLAGCGSYPAPTERVTSTEAAIRGASEVGASQVPRAALHLKLAQEQTDKAKRLMQDGYNKRAELALKQAQADAELAIAIAKENQALEKAKTAQAEVEKYRSTLKR
jgi:hypothetical protein